MMTGNNCLGCSKFELFIGFYGIKKCKGGDGALVDGHTECTNSLQFKNLICADCERNLSMCETCPSRGD